jgi:putative Holliday junction resolvase
VLNRTLAVDWGTKRLGMAVSDGSLATGLPTLPTQGFKESLRLVCDVARDQTAETIIIGLPLLPSGDEGDSVRQAKKLGDALTHRGFKVVYRDERWTTEDALEKLKSRGRSSKKGDADRLVAALLLQEYLDEAAGS